MEVFYSSSSIQNVGEGVGLVQYIGPTADISLTEELIT